MSSTNRDYYELLGVARDCDEATIKKAFRKLARSVAISTKNGLQFTDVNELLLKHLIYLRVASLDKPVQHWWSGPRSPISDVITLANQSGVGMSAVYRLMKSLKIGMHVEHIFDNMTRGPQLCLVDPAALLNTWLSVASRRPSVPSVPLSPLYPPSTNKSDRIRHKFIDDIWQRHQGKAPFAIGGWSALERYRKKIVAGETPIQLWMKTPHDVEEIMKQENLVVCNPKEAWFHVMVSPTPRSTFAGLIMKEGQAPIVDLWQAALDVCGDPARGSEQAESIARALVREE